jgi:hypothetical protein
MDKWIRAQTATATGTNRMTLAIVIPSEARDLQF